MRRRSARSKKKSRKLAQSDLDGLQQQQDGGFEYDMSSSFGSGTADSQQQQQQPVSASALSRRRKTLQPTAVNAQGLSVQETAFLPKEVRTRIQSNNNRLLHAPFMVSTDGCVLFVDISGFTALGARLRRKHSALKAAALLAKQITDLLARFTDIVIAHGGDVSKYAGDAILCVFEQESLDDSEEDARACAVAILAAIDVFNGETKNSLTVHGGIAKGSVLHFHLGSGDCNLRWYLIAGEAVVAATALVDVAGPGEIIVREDVGDEERRATRANRVMGSVGGAANPTRGTVRLQASSDKDLKRTLAHLSRSDEHSSGAALRNAQSVTKNRKTFSARDGKVKLKDLLKDAKKQDAANKVAGGEVDVPVEIITSKTRVERTHETYAFVRKPVAQVCSAYIPKALRSGKLNEADSAGSLSEMRDRVGIVFVGLDHLALTKQEFEQKSIEFEKLEELNKLFVRFTRIAHSFGGEIRDFLFDDKGCIFIAVFGAHKATENAALKSIRAGMAIVNEAPLARVGCSSGTCFVGTCGTYKRADFIVMGHDVNMAARYMILGEKGEVLASPSVFRKTNDVIDYSVTEVMLDKRAQRFDTGDQDVDVFAKAERKQAMARARTETQGPSPSVLSKAYRPNIEEMQRDDLMQQYRYQTRARSIFVGRAKELVALELGINAAASQKSSSAMAVVGDVGMGKSALIKRFRKIADGRLRICVSYGLASLRKPRKYASVSMLLLAMLNLDEHSTKHEVVTRLKELDTGLTKTAGAVTYSAIMGVEDALGTYSSYNPTELKKILSVEITPGLVAEFLARVLKKVLSERPVFFVLEDLQWVDLESLQTISLMLGNVAALPKFSILFTMRPLRGKVDRRKRKEKLSKKPKNSDLSQTSSKSSDADVIVRHGEQEEEEAFAIGQKNAVSVDQTAVSKPDETQLTILRLLRVAEKKCASYVQIVLRPLSREESDVMFARALGASSPKNVQPLLGSIVYSHARGHPALTFLLVGWMRHMLVFDQARALWVWDESAVRLRDVTFPNSVSQVVRSMLDRLDATTRIIIRVAAVCSVQQDIDFSAKFVSEMAHAIDPTRKLMKSPRSTMYNSSRQASSSERTLPITIDAVVAAFLVAIEEGVLTHFKDPNLNIEDHMWRFKDDNIARAIYGSATKSLRQETVIALSAWRKRRAADDKANQ